MELILKDEAYKVIGICMEVHNNLEAGFLEIVYKDALELEFRRAGILHEREKEYLVNYKGVVLPHKFKANIVILNQIELEFKFNKRFDYKDISNEINYLKVSGNRLALLVNFGNFVSIPVG